MSANLLVLAIAHREAELAAVRRTAYRFSGRYAVTIDADADGAIVRLSGAIDDAERLEREFRASLLDDALRVRVEADTAPLRCLIVEAALRSALREPETGA